MIFRTLDRDTRGLLKQVLSGQQSLYQARDLAFALPCIKTSKIHQSFITQQCRKFDVLVRTVQGHNNILAEIPVEDDSWLSDDSDAVAQRFEKIKSFAALYDNVLTRTCYTQLWLFCSWSSLEHLERWVFGLPLPFCTDMHLADRTPAHPLYLRIPRTFGYLYMNFVGHCHTDARPCELLSRSEYVADNFSSYARELDHLPDLDIETIVAIHGDDIAKILSARPLVHCLRKSLPLPRHNGRGRNLIFCGSDRFVVSTYLHKQENSVIESRDQQEAGCDIM